MNKSLWLDDTAIETSSAKAGLSLAHYQGEQHEH